MKKPPYNPSTDYIRVATATPQVAIAHPQKNTEAILELYNDAVKQNVSLVVFPELSITGYSLHDLVRQSSLLDAAREELDRIRQATINQQTVAVVGLPLMVGNALYNCAAVVGNGKIFGIVPKTHLPTYNEFYEKRWFQSWTHEENTTIRLADTDVPFGTKQLFTIAGAIVGIEICEDLWVADTPSTYLVRNGATVIANPSASPELTGKQEYRDGLIQHTAGRLLCGYIYSGADVSESTAEIVMSGNAMISEMGAVLAQRPVFSDEARLVVSEIDLQHIRNDRMKDTNFPNDTEIVPVDTGVSATQTDLIRTVDPHPFVPKGDAAARFEKILQIQAHGLAIRLEKTGIKKVVLGLSGGLDSTLALLVAERAARLRNIPTGDLILTITMPGKASSKRTQTNAVKLAKALGIPNEEIPIGSLSAAQLEALEHNGSEDVAYENVQARTRQAILFNRANQIGGLVLGTGDLSEIALGWCTYNGDHMSHYNVNASIPKSLVRAIVRYAALHVPKTAQEILEDILDTPVSPELTGNGKSITQSTEDLIGPYELHDFFLYHFVRFMESPAKIRFLATRAFAGTYTKEEVEKWFTVFITRFYHNQWKRQAMPDGAKVGLSLSPKGDWRMAAEAELLD